MEHAEAKIARRVLVKLRKHAIRMEHAEAKV